MATHELHHKIDEVIKFLRSIEDTTKKVKALLDQTTMKKLRREEVKKFSLSEALKEQPSKRFERKIEKEYLSDEEKGKLIIIYNEPSLVEKIKKR